MASRPHSQPGRGFDDLPDELVDKILRFLLLFPGKLRITATVTDDGTETSYTVEQMMASSYKFGLAFKVPKFMIAADTSRHTQPSEGYYSDLEKPPVLLAVLEVDKRFRSSGKPIFYGKNYFEALDDHEDVWLHDRTPDHTLAGQLSTHRFLELMSAMELRDGTRSYDDPPLSMMTRLNIDSKELS